MTTQTVKTGKAQVYNLIILDKSGSMGRIRTAAVDGFNETLAGIKKAQEKFAETQDHFVSLVAFCGCSIDKIFDKVPAMEAKPLSQNDYQPCCMTPLFDAMGITLTSMQKHVKEIEDSVVVVTIITDGEENASREYNGLRIKQMVEELQKEGWAFTYMGANQDSVEVAIKMSIRNARNFDYNDDGIQRACFRDSSTRMNFFTRLNKFKENEAAAGIVMDEDERNASYLYMADQAFDEEEKA